MVRYKVFTECALILLFSVCCLSFRVSADEKKQQDKNTVNEPNKKVSHEPDTIVSSSTHASDTHQNVSLSASKGKAYEIYDFGKIKEGTYPRHAFSYTNKTDKEIKILKTRIPCGCADVVLNETILKPKESFTFNVKFDSKGHDGIIEKSFYLITDSKETPVIKYVLKANVIAIPAPVCVVPAYLDLSDTKPKETRELKATVENRGHLELVIYSVKVTKAFNISTELPLKIAAGEKKDLEFTFTAPEKKGKFYDKIVFTSNDPLRPSVITLVKGEVEK